MADGPDADWRWCNVTWWYWILRAISKARSGEIGLAFALKRRRSTR